MKIIQTKIHHIVDEVQHDDSKPTDFFVAIVLFVSTDSKLHNAHNDCGDGSNIQNQGLVELGSKEFHCIRVWEISVENVSTTNVD